MITENPNTGNEELKKTSEENLPPKTENQNDNPIENQNIPEISETSAVLSPDVNQEEKKVELEEKVENPSEEKVEDRVKSEEKTHEIEEKHDSIFHFSLSQALEEMEKIINSKKAGADHKNFNDLKNHAFHLIQKDVDEQKQEFLEKGNTEENFSFEHSLQSKLTGLINIFKEKLDDFHKQQESNQEKNLEIRHQIIDRLKNLNSNSEPGTNLFKEIREIKQDWENAGQVPKSEFKLLNNDYFHHLNQFYALLDLNKEYLEQEYAHNLEKRQHIIERAKILETEPSVQKALNELQYLHKLWKEEAEPVAEEFRESTWEEFKEVSNKIHERKGELSAHIEEEQKENLAKKNAIIEEIKKFLASEKEANHNYWQNAIKKIEELRLEFLKIGSVPRKVSNDNWTEFKEALKAFNVNKNNYYKDLKNDQQKNLEDKLKLIQTAKDNQNAEDWETLLPLYKKLQLDWKKIGHVPRSHTNKIWEEFREACNVFFNNYRDKNNVAEDNWKENYKQKKEILDQLKEVGEEEGSVEKIEELKNSWNSIGKVPKDKISINSEFNKILKEKMKMNNVSVYELKEEGLSENQLTDKARKIKSQISDLEAEIAKMENNLAFFNNPSKDNPLLKDTFLKIDEKKEQLEAMKQSLHHIITGE